MVLLWEKEYIERTGERTLNAFKSRNCDVVERGQQCLELQERKILSF